MAIGNMEIHIKTAKKMSYSNYEIINYYFFAKNTSVARPTGRTLDPPLHGR